MAPHLPPLIKLNDNDRFAVRVGFGRDMQEKANLGESAANAGASAYARGTGKIVRIHVTTRPGEPLLRMYVPDAPGLQGRARRYEAREIAAGGAGPDAFAEWQRLSPEQRGEQSGPVRGIFAGAGGDEILSIEAAEKALRAGGAAEASLIKNGTMEELRARRDQVQAELDAIPARVRPGSYTEQKARLLGARDALSRALARREEKFWRR